MNHLALGVDVARLERERLREAQSRGVEQGAEDAEDVHLQLRQKHLHLVGTEHVGQLLGVARPGQERDVLPPAERPFVQLAQRREVLAQPLGAEVAVREMAHPAAQVLPAQLAGRPAEEAPQEHDALDVGLLGLGAQTPEGHVLYHSSSQLGHESSSVSAMGPRPQEKRAARIWRRTTKRRYVLNCATADRRPRRRAGSPPRSGFVQHHVVQTKMPRP